MVAVLPVLTIAFMCQMSLGHAVSWLHASSSQVHPSVPAPGCLQRPAYL